MGRKMRYYVNISRARGAGQERMIPLQQKRRNMRGPALLAALSMVLTAVPAALAVETAAGTPPAVTEAPYSDVPAEAWYAPFAADLKQDGAVSGYEDGTFRPDNAVTVGEALVMVLAAAGFDRREATGEHWSSGNADFALEKGFVTREQVTDLDSAVSRLTVAQMAAKALNLRPSRNETPFGDVDDGYVTVLYEKIQLSGELEEDGTLSYHPEDSITRSELVAIIWRMKNTDVHAGQIAYEGYSQTFYLDVLETVPAFSYIPQLFRMEGDYLTYDDGTVQGHLGVDVSQFQGEIDWEQAADAGVEFAIVRVGGRGYTEGKLYEDTYFDRNVQGALDAGLAVGAYFFSQAIAVEEALEEARFVLERVRDYDLTMPVVFDWEMVSDSSARTNAIDSDTMNEVALAFCGAIQEAGYESMIYFNSYQGYVKYDLSKLLDHSFWFAQYQAQPSFYYDFQMWQYSSKGSVPGIQGEVDMNLYFGALEGGERPKLPNGQEAPLDPGINPEPYGADRLTDFVTHIRTSRGRTPLPRRGPPGGRHRTPPPDGTRRRWTERWPRCGRRG